MEIQKAQGYIFFENKSYDDVVRVFGNFKFDLSSFLFFEKISENHEELRSSGVYIDGEINLKYTKDNLVRLFRKLMGLEAVCKNHNVSIESEDEIEVFSKVEEGGLISVVVDENESTEKLAEELEKNFFAKKICTRISKAEKKITIDLLCKNPVDIERLNKEYVGKGVLEKVDVMELKK